MACRSASRGRASLYVRLSPWSLQCCCRFSRRCPRAPRRSSPAITIWARRACAISGSTPRAAMTMRRETHERTRSARSSRRGTASLPAPTSPMPGQCLRPLQAYPTVLSRLFHLILLFVLYLHFPGLLRLASSKRIRPLEAVRRLNYLRFFSNRRSAQGYRSRPPHFLSR